jgi:hypothetical protein
MSYLPSVRRVSTSAGTGALLALIIGMLVFGFGAQTVAVTAYLQPGIVLGGLVSPLVPTAVVYWVAPEGGPYAFLLIALACAFFFWSTLLGGIHYFWRRAKHP